MEEKSFVEKKEITITILMTPCDKHSWSKKLDIFTLFYVSKCKGGGRKLRIGLPLLYKYNIFGNLFSYFILKI